jgi:hypothetical protein
MKKLTAVLLVLVAASLSFGQSASTVFSTLRIKGVTSEGGTPKYSNYAPRLGNDGKLSVTFMPDNLYSNVYEYVDQHGSAYDRAILNSFIDGINNTISSLSLQIGVAASNAVMGITNSIYKYEKDPFFTAFTNSNGFGLGGGSCVYGESWQIGAGTNTTEGTLKFLDSTVIDEFGEVPTNTVPWAATRYDFTNAINRIDESYAPLSGGFTFTGDFSIDTGVFAVTNVCFYIDGLNDRLTGTESRITVLEQPRQELTLRSTNKVWSLTITDSGDLVISEVVQPTTEP